MHVLIDIGIRNVVQLQPCYCDVVDRSLFTLVPVSVTRLFCTYFFRIRKIIVKYRYWFSSRDNRVAIFYNWFAVRYIYTSLWNLNVFFFKLTFTTAAFDSGYVPQIFFIYIKYLSIPASCTLQRRLNVFMVTWRMC